MLVKVTFAIVGLTVILSCVAAKEASDKQQEAKNANQQNAKQSSSQKRSGISASATDVHHCCGCSTAVIGAVGALILALVAYYKWTAPKGKVLKLNYPFDLNKQSIVHTDEKDVRIASWGNAIKYEPGVNFQAQTIYDIFLHGLKASEDGECLGWRPSPQRGYSWLRYGEVLKRAHAIGSAFVSLGLKRNGDENKFVGIYAQNCPEWSISCLAAVSQSITVVPLYDSLGADSFVFIINQAEIPLVICDTHAKAIALVDQKNNLPSLKHIIVIISDQITDELREKAKKAGVSLHSFSALWSLGEQQPQEPRPPKAEDLYIVCYTSGTTGTPKGVMLTHRNIVLTAACLIKIMEEAGLKITKEHSLFSYLPLAHMLEQGSHVVAYYCGARIGFFQGAIKNVQDDMKELRPSLMPVVPRILNRLYDKLQTELRKSSIKRIIFNLAYKSKLAEQKSGVFRNDTIWDRILFNKIRAEFGGNLSFVVTGSAPVAKEVLNFARIAIGCPILEGYGQTESTMAITATLPGDFDGGHVGGPIPCAHVLLEDVPDLKYFAKDGKGEILIRGPCVMKGYFKDPEKTKETIDDKGWLHTGDVGEWLPTGALRIIDRKKHIFKLAQGEYVAPEKIENVYLHCPLVSQIFVDGESTERNLVAVVVLDQHEMLNYAEKHPQLMQETDLQEAEEGEDDDQVLLRSLAKSPHAEEAVLAEMTRVGKENKLSSIEQVKAIHLVTERFSIENGLLTPTLKNKRPALRELYAETIKILYEELKEGEKAD